MSLKNSTSKLSHFTLCLFAFVALSFIGTDPIAGQSQGATHDAAWLTPIANIALHDDPITLRSRAEAEKPFTVAGECGAMMGQQNGSFESWIFPVKLFSHLTLDGTRRWV